MVGIIPTNPNKICRFSSAHFALNIVFKSGKLWYTLLYNFINDTPVS